MTARPTVLDDFAAFKAKLLTRAITTAQPPFVLPEISLTAAERAANRLECPSTVRVYEYGRLVGEYNLSDTEDTSDAVLWLSEQHDELRESECWPRKWPVYYSVVQGGHCEVWRMHGVGLGRIVKRGPWCPQCREMGHSWCESKGGA